MIISIFIIRRLDSHSRSAGHYWSNGIYSYSVSGFSRTEDIDESECFHNQRSFSNSF